MAPRPRSLRVARLALGRLLIALVVFGAIAGVALACTSPAPTSLSTKLSGGGKEGEEIAVSEGTGVKDQATLSGENAAKATGSIEYLVYADSKCKELVTKAGKFEFTGGKVPASEEKKLEAAAVYYWQAVYSGDSLDQGSTSPCGKEVLTVKAKVTLATKLSGGGKEGEEITVSEGAKVKDTATLSGTKASSATGTVHYAAYKDKECKELATKAGEGKVEGTKAAGSEEKELEAAAVYYWQAEYLGDSLHEKSTGTCGKEVETVKAKTTLSTLLSGEEEDENPITGEEITVSEGTWVKDTATLSGTNASTATGTVHYAAYKDKECKELATKAGEGKVEGTKAAGSEEKELEAAAVYYWQAEYLGDSLHEKSTSPCGKEVLTVKAATSLTISLRGESQEGEEITILSSSEAEDQAILSGTNSATAGGKAIYDVYSDDECENLVTEAGEVTVNSGSIPPSSKEELDAGTYYWQATYQGDNLHQGSESACGENVLNVVSCTFPYCEPTITPGVRLWVPGEVKTAGCTAGPILTQGTDFFLLTAGHCFAEEEGEPEIGDGRTVKSAYPQAPEALKVIGEKAKFLYTKEYDTAEVNVEKPEWLLPNGNVPPVLVEWEPALYLSLIAGTAPSKVGDTTCHTGATSGTHCGEILRIGELPSGVDSKEWPLAKKTLVETSAMGKGGDSGGPVFLPDGGEVLIQGTHVSGGELYLHEKGDVKNGDSKITNFPTTCKKIEEMQLLWPVPIKAEKGITGGTTVVNCEQTGATVTIEMSAPATKTIEGLLMEIGHPTLTWYEPMWQIEAAYPGQTLLVK